jgi:predicted phage tail protein
MNRRWLMRALLALLPALVLSGAAIAAPTAPSPVSPADGVEVVEPFTISWTAATDPTGIQDYRWEVSTTSTFSTFAMRGAPGPVTQDQVSGLPNGTYFWHVKAVNNSFVEGPWSAVSSFTVTGQSTTTPGTPAFTGPANGAQYHPFEAITFAWTPATGANHYLFQDAQDPNFQQALFTIDTSNTSNTSVTFSFADPNTYYARVRAVSPDGVMGLPSSTLQVVISYNAPLPPPPALLSPADGAGPLSLPITLDWSDVPNAQPNGYEVQIDPNPNFPGGTGGVELTTFVGPTSQVQVNSLTGGTKYWRVRSYHGNASPTTSAVTAWSAVRSFIVNPGSPSLVSLTFNPTSASGAVFSTSSFGSRM